MIQLHDNEEITLVIRKHWFVMTGPLIGFIIAILVPPVVLTVLPYATAELDQRIVETITDFLLSLYMMSLIIFLFFIWTDYYLDMWVVTNERIIDVEQHGLFSREVSEVPVSRVQDITIEIHGFFETILKFGTIRIQTAGEREFVIHNVPNLYEAKEAILKHASARTPPASEPSRTTEHQSETI